MIYCNICDARLLDYRDRPEGWTLAMIHHKDGTHEVVWMRKKPLPDGGPK